ncbi:MAG: SDR family oxidoreductase [Elusimicrobiota bacterium]
MDRLLITGGSGFIGSRLLRDLAQGWQAAGTSRSGQGGLLALDLCDPASIDRVFRAFAPSAVVHTAATSDPDAAERDPAVCERVNRDAPERLAKLCQETGARLIHFSTDLVFDGAKAFSTETDPPRPISVYGRCKHQAEQRVLAACPGAVALRVATVYGRALAGRPSFTDTLREKLSRGESFKALIDQWRTPTAVAQLPRVIGELLRRPELSGILHWTCPDRFSRFEFAQAFCRAFGYPETLLKPSTMAELSFLAPRPRDTSLDSSRLAGRLGFQPWSLAEGLEALKKEG